jgi:adenylate kinase family enzyme
MNDGVVKSALPRPFYVLISGPVASGKTKLAKALANELSLPILSKDTVKAALARVVEVPDVDCARKVGEAAVSVLFAIAKEVKTGTIVESVWRGDQVISEIRQLNGTIVEVFCRCSQKVMEARYLARERPPRYVPEHSTTNEIWSHETREPIAGGWPVIEVDTSAPVEVEALAAEIRTHLQT